MKVVSKLRLKNFKRFENLEVNFSDDINLLIGDNESGKSSILLALDLVLSGSRSKVETLGLESLFNISVVDRFLSGEKRIENLPVMAVEIYLNEQHNPDLNGHNNLDARGCDGLRVLCEPIEEYSKDLQAILSQPIQNFPYEYYSIKFMTFQGDPYGGYRKYLRHLLIDSSQINNEYATREYIKAVYHANSEASVRSKHQNEYRRHKSEFRDNVLKDLNLNLKNYQFSVKTSSKANLETDLTLTENSISIENKGKGRQCFIKTEFALRKNKAAEELDILLLEEPENHLSHVNMKKLVGRMAESKNKQLVVATHNNLIATRLDLRKAVLLNSSSMNTASLSDLPEETAKFFMKAPDNNILEFVLSRKVILVEGDAEFILFDVFFQKVCGKSLKDSNVHVISVGGTSFKRYLDVAKILDIKTAVVRDNDGDYQAKCIDSYSDYVADNVKIFFEQDNRKSTFENCFYEVNKDICDDLFGKGRRKKSVLEYMLDEKTDVAFEVLDRAADKVATPGYIENAINWISA